MSAPAEILARRIAERLAAEGVVRAADVDVLARRLAAGDVRQRDWEGIVDGASLGGDAAGGPSSTPDDLPF